MRGILYAQTMVADIAMLGYLQVDADVSIDHPVLDWYDRALRRSALQGQRDD